MDVIGQLRAPAALPQGKIPGMYLVLDWVPILADPDAVRVSKNLLLLLEIEPRSVTRSARGVIAVPNLIVWRGVETGSERFCFMIMVMKIWLT